MIGGKSTDIFVRYWARTHGGRFSPEARLVLLLPLTVLVVAGLLLFGFGVQNHLPWIVVFIAFALINTLSGISSISMNYVIDTYFEVSPEALLLINGVKNVLAFAFTFAVLPWTQSAGYEKVSSTLSGGYRQLLMCVAAIWNFISHIRRMAPAGCAILPLWEKNS